MPKLGVQWLDEHDGMAQMKQVLSSEEHLADELSADFQIFFNVFLTHHEAEVFNDFALISPSSNCVLPSS